MSEKDTSKGTLISFDGIDSSGKETQAKKLENRFLSLGYRVGRFETPDYTTDSGRRLKELFQGVRGSWDDLSWHDKMKLIASNRMEHREEAIDILKNEGVVIYDRYVPSSIAHMVVDARVERGGEVSRETAAEEVRRLEYVYNGMPREDLSIFLDVPPVDACQLLEVRKKQYQDPDEATDELDLQEQIYKEYKLMTQEEPAHFARVGCCEEGSLSGPDEIGEKVWKAVADRFPYFNS